MILETERLVLRKLNEDDAKKLSEYRSKKEVAKYQSWHQYSLLIAKRRCRRCAKMEDLYRIGIDYNLAIVLKENNELIGDIFVGVLNNRTVTLGYTLDSQYWHHGYAREVITAYFRLLRCKGFRNVLCYVYPENVASKKLLDDFGFIQFQKSRYYGDEGYKKVL